MNKARSTSATMSDQLATLLPVASTVLLVWTGLKSFQLPSATAKLIVKVQPLKRENKIVAKLPQRNDFPSVRSAIRSVASIRN